MEGYKSSLRESLFKPDKGKKCPRYIVLDFLCGSSQLIIFLRASVDVRLYPNLPSLLSVVTAGEEEMNLYFPRVTSLRELLYIVGKTG